VVAGGANRVQDIGTRAGDFAVAGFTVDGAPDPTFGQAGVARTDFG
jgi:hypothetical protein